MEQLIVLALSAFFLSTFLPTHADTVLSAVLSPKADDTKLSEAKLSRQGRSYYYEPRYGTGRPYERLEYGRLDYERPSRCGRCLEDRDDRDDDYERRRGYDDDRRSHRPTSGHRYDRNKGDDDDDRRYSTDRNSNSQKNGTEDDNDKDNKNRYDDKDSRPSGGRRDRDRDRDRDRNRDRHDDRDRYRPDYYDRFLSRDRDRYDRPYYEDPYRERRPLYDRYDDPYGRYDGYGTSGYRRPVYDDRYDRVGAYDDAYGGYGPSAGRGPHDRCLTVRDRYDYSIGRYGSPRYRRTDYDRIAAYFDSFGGYAHVTRASPAGFRPWDETYRGQAGWDAGGRGYYFASGRPEAAPAPAWGRPEYARPQYGESGWQNVGYGSGGYRDPAEYQGSLGYGSGGYRQDLSAGYGAASSGYGGSAGYGQGSAGYGQGGAGYGQGGAGYGQASGWRNVGERRPYRDQSGVSQLDNRGTDNRGYNQPSRTQNYGQQPTRQGYVQPSPGQGNGYSNANSNYANTNSNSYSNANNGYSSSSTTPNTSYLFQREDERVTAKVTDETTKSPQTS